MAEKLNQFELFRLTPEEATNLLIKEIGETRDSSGKMKKEPDLEFIKDILTYSVIDINADSNYSGLPYGCSNPTPLIAAVDMNIIEIIQILLNAGADPNGQNRFGATAIWSASFLGKVESVRELLKHPEINPNIILHDKGFETPTALGVAACRGNIKTVEELLKHPKTNVNIRYSESSWTPLMEAACENYIHIIKMLLNHPGIDVTLKDWDGKTAWDIASDEVHEKFPQLNPNS
jgi:ankyrin repeat protein